MAGQESRGLGGMGKSHHLRSNFPFADRLRLAYLLRKILNNMDVRNVSLFWPPLCRQLGSIGAVARACVRSCVRAGLRAVELHLTKAPSRISHVIYHAVLLSQLKTKNSGVFVDAFPKHANAAQTGRVHRRPASTAGPRPGPHCRPPLRLPSPLAGQAVLIIGRLLHHAILLRSCFSICAEIEFRNSTEKSN